MTYKERKASDLHNGTAVVRNDAGTCAAISTNLAQDVLDARGGNPADLCNCISPSIVCERDDGQFQIGLDAESALGFRDPQLHRSLYLG